MLADPRAQDAIAELVRDWTALQLIGTRFRASPVPVAVAQPWLLDETGMTDSADRVGAAERGGRHRGRLRRPAPGAPSAR
jgi:hypothetical protein